MNIILSAYLYILSISTLLSIIAVFIDWLTIRPIKGRGVVIAEYEPPVDLTPLQVGNLFQTTLKREFYISEIFYLAELGYIKITKENDKFILEKIKDGDEKLKDFDIELIKYIFTNSNKVAFSELHFTSDQGATINSDNSDYKYPSLGTIIKDGKTYPANKGKSFLYRSADPNLYHGLLKITIMVKNQNMEQGYSNNLIQSIKGIFILLGFLFFFLSFMTYFDLFPASLILFIYGIKKTVCTRKGMEMREYMMGFKKYMETVEKDTIEYTDSPENFSNKFSKILPYAILLHVETKWLGEFSNFYRSSGN